MLEAGTKIVMRFHLPHSQKHPVYHVWCPACQFRHSFDSEQWEFDGNRNMPTFHPSLLRKSLRGVEGTVCHSFLIKGVWNFLTDCTHHMAGQNCEMQEFPLRFQFRPQMKGEWEA